MSSQSVVRKVLRFIKSKRPIFWLLTIAISIIASYLIVYHPVYFFAVVFFFLLLTVLAWKTEESFFALIFYLPFQIALNVSSGIDLASGRLLIIMLFMIWLLKGLAKKNLDIPHGVITWLIIVFLGLALFSAVFSIDPDRSLIRTLYFLSIMPVYFLAAHYLNSLQNIKKAIFVLLSSAVLVSLIGSIQFLAQFFTGIDPVMGFLAKNIAPVFYGQSFSAAVLANPSWLVNIGGATILRTISLFPDPHVLAFYLGLIIPSVLSLMFVSGSLKLSGKTKILIFLAGLILFFALLTTFSRAGYAGAFFGISAVVLLGWKLFGGRVKFMILAAVIFGGIIFFNSSSASLGLILNRFLSSFNPSEGSNSERILNWNRALRIISDHPLTGVGVGAYSLAVDPRSPAKSAITAHNTYLDIAAEMGLAALLVWFTLLVTAVRKLVKVLFLKNNSNREAGVIALGLIGSFVWFIVQTIFDTAIYSPALFTILMIYFAIAVNLEKENIYLKS